MNKPHSAISEWLIGLLWWLTLSPIFYFYTEKRNMLSKKWRICLLLISPLFIGGYYIILLLVASIIISIVIFCAPSYDYPRKPKFTEKDVVEKVTGVSFPDFECIDFKQLHTAFNGDYTDQITIEFSEIPPAAFYHTLDSLSAIRNSNWYEYDSIYSYGTSWRPGDAPQGVNEDGSMMFDIEIKKGSKQAVIKYGAW